jgi:hypothetical protein
VTEVGDADLRLQAVHRPLLRDRRDRRVVDEQVEAVEPPGHPRGEVPDAAQAAQVDLLHREGRARQRVGDAGDHRLRLRRVAHGQHDVRAGRGEGPGDRGTDTAAGPRDEGGAAGQVRPPVVAPQLVEIHRVLQM